MDESVKIKALAHGASNLVSHRFDVIDMLDDGSTIPVEALSEDHSIGLYGVVAPRKMREHRETYSLVDLPEFRPVRVPATTGFGARYEEFLEYVPLRSVRFRAEQLQYLEEGWEASLRDVNYPLYTVLALSHLLRETFGAVFLYLNRTLPMPLWLRTEPLDTELVGAQAAIQVTSGGRMRPTNIHTECPMEFARRWVDAAHDYYDVPVTVA